MPEINDIPVDALPQPFVTFGPAGAVVIGGLAVYGAVSLSFDATHKVKAILAARKDNKESETKDNDAKS